MLMNPGEHYTLRIEKKNPTDPLLHPVAEYPVGQVFTLETNGETHEFRVAKRDESADGSVTTLSLECLASAEADRV